MSLSVEQNSNYLAKWVKLISPILSNLLLGTNDVFLSKQICSTFWTVMSGFRLGTVLEELADGYDIFIDDEWSVELPRLLIEEDDYKGDVIIDLAGTRTCIRLEYFCFVAKLAAIFYTKFIDHDFEPWTYFLNIDQMCEKFRRAESS